MISKKIKHWTWGVVGMLALMFHPSAEAIYSPVLSQRAFEIKNHILASQAQHGTGTLTSIVETLIDQDRIRREQRKTTGTSGHAEAARKEVVLDVTEEIFYRPLDGLMSIFNYLPSTNSVISNCLRNDIWTLEALKNQVVQEMIKAYMMVDLENGNILKEDYRYLLRNIEFLKKYGGGDPQTRIFSPETDIEMTVNDYLFGSAGERNYYVFSFPPDNGCPQGDFELAFDQIKNSMKTLSTLATGGGSDWSSGSIKAMAEARAKQRAAQWVAANQISLTLAGEEGTMQQSLINGGGWDRLQGQLQTEYQILKNNVVKPLTPLFSWSLWRDVGETADLAEINCAYYYSEDNTFRRCNEQQIQDKKTCEEGTEEEKAAIRCDLLRSIRGRDSALVQFKILESEQKLHRNATESTQLAYRYSLSLNSVGESNIESLDEVLTELNGEVKRGVEALGAGAGPGLISLRNNLEFFAARQCFNR